MFFPKTTINAHSHHNLAVKMIEMRRMTICAVLMLVTSTALAQDVDRMTAVMETCGTYDPEDMDPDEVERLADLMHRKIAVNKASAADLTRSGLFTAYQAASLKDYISRHGYVLSFTELASVDGFNEKTVGTLRPFLSLESDGVSVGQKGGKHIENDLSLKGGFRLSAQENDWSIGVKYRLSVNDMVSVSMAFSKSYDGSFPSAISGGVGLRKGRFLFLAGDFNARFGQGLGLWSGMSISGTGSPSSFLKRPSGLSQTCSYTGSTALTGTALGIRMGRWVLNSLVGLPGLKDIRRRPDKLRVMPAVNMTRYGRYGQVSITHFAQLSGFAEKYVRIPDMKTSADVAFCFQGVNAYGEAAFDWVSRCCAAVAGTDFSAGGHAVISLLARYYPAGYSSTYSAAVRSSTRCSNEYAVSAGCVFSAGRRIRISGKEGFGADVARYNGQVSVDAAYYPDGKASAEGRCMQIKAVMNMEVALSGHITLKARVSERIRSWGQPCRTDVRADLLARYGRWIAAARLNCLRYVGTGVLGYAESGYKDPCLGVYARIGLFRIDSWEDRIYVYERDAPGNFTVPAFYGRGLWASFAASWKASRKVSLYARASYVGYPFMEKKKPGKAELKLQCVFRF